MNVTTTPSRLGNSGFLIQNLGPDTLYVGEASVNSDNGFRVISGAAVVVGDTTWDVYVVSEGDSEVYLLGEGGGIYAPPVIPEEVDLSGYETTSAHNASQSAALADYAAKSDLSAYLTSAAAASGYQPLDSDLSAIAALTTTSYGRGLLALADAAATRTLLSLVIGTNVQAWDADLDAIAAITTSSYGRALLNLANAAAADWVPNALFDANTTLVAHADNTPVAVAISANQVVGRGNSGNIKGLTAAETAAIVSTEVFTQGQAFNAQTGTTYTLVAGDAGKNITLNNASAITLTLPQDSDATIAIGTYVDITQLGAGQVTVVAGTGATLRKSGLTAKARAQYSRLGAQKISANTWSLFGDLASS